MSVPRFHDLTVARVSPEAAGSVAITFAVPDDLQESFSFQPGQFLTLRTTIDGQDVRRNYSICSTRSRYSQAKELEVGIRPMEGGVFSNWAATQLKAGDKLAVMPPDGRFTIKKPRALHRVGFAAGSGITPILSIIASTMEESDSAKFTLVYGNRRMSSVMFNEALQDLKDKYKNRLTLIHVLSRQAQEVPLLEGRIDAAKVRQLIGTLLPAIPVSGLMDPVSSLEGGGALIGAIYPTTHFLTISSGTFSKALGFADLVGSFVPLALAIPVLTLLSALLLKKQAK